MTINDLDPTIKEVAEAYRLNIKVDTVVDRVTIETDFSNWNHHFYWDTSYDKQDFFDDLKIYFIKQGEANINRW